MGLSRLFRYAAAAAAVTLLGVTSWQLRAPLPAITPNEPPPEEPAPEPPQAAAPLAAAPLAAAPLAATPLAAASPPPTTGAATTPATPQGEPGAYYAPSVIMDGSPRVYPLTRNVWVRPEPSSTSSWIGFLWFGSSVRLRSTEPAKGPGCRGHWYAVEPRGYVCVDDDRATLDPEHPAVQGLTRYSPNLASPWPHRYGESIDLQRYPTLPSERHQRAKEGDYRGHQALLARARGGQTIEALLGIDTSLPALEELPLPLLPKTLQMERERLQARSTVAWTREQLHEGRSFLLASDLKWVPKDRVKPYPPVTFQGVRLGRDAKLPLAFFRRRDRPMYRRLSEGQFEATGRAFSRLSWVELSGRSEPGGKETYLETREPGVFVRQADAVLPRPAAKTPWGTPLHAAEDTAAPSRGRKTWMEVSILGGWLLAYEGQTPVFATLVSSGRGGGPQGDIDPVETASTPVGRFKITGKFMTATMVAPNDLTHSDVPWVHNFSGPHALHGAYWHDGWGELKSGGCINVSPVDGRWLLREFTEPRLPDGWHGVRWVPELEAATTLIVRKD